MSYRSAQTFEVHPTAVGDVRADLRCESRNSAGRHVARADILAVALQQRIGWPTGSSDYPLTRNHAAAGARTTLTSGRAAALHPTFTLAC